MKNYFKIKNETFEFIYSHVGLTDRSQRSFLKNSLQSVEQRISKDKPTKENYVKQRDIFKVIKKINKQEK